MRFLNGFMGVFMVFSASATAEAAGDLFSDTWDAVDRLGRALPDTAQAGPPRADRTIGLFYFLWLGEHARGGPYDVSKILAEHPNAMQEPENPAWGPKDAFHHWGEPLFGYYRSDDPWVLRKHARMLADAQVDVIIFDVTNRFTYRKEYLALCEAFSAVRAEGTPAPYIAFLCPFWDPKSTARQLYDEFYQPGLYPELWFQWEGKPLILATPDKVDKDLRDFFTFRDPVPSYFNGPDKPDQWGWLEVYPQHVFRNSRGEAEQMTVGVAQNAVAGRLATLSEAGALGRSYHKGSWDTRPNAVDYGFNFTEQFEHALKQDPRFIFITGWNEWIAMRMDEFNGVRAPVMFVDQFDHENSRDIEPMRGGHEDNYYYQMIQYIRRYKGVRPQPAAGLGKEIGISESFSQWDGIAPEYRNHRGSTFHRNHPGYAEYATYTNTSGRNDIVRCKVTHSESHVYFYVETAEAITPHSDPHWMRLYINLDRNAGTGWEGYDFLVNRENPGETTATVERNTGGWNWEKCGEADWRAEGNQMHLAIPRAALGIEADASLDFNFKWSDNTQKDGDILAFTLYGDAAPPGRFSYRYFQR